MTSWDTVQHEASAARLLQTLTAPTASMSVVKRCRLEPSVGALARTHRRRFTPRSAAPYVAKRRVRERTDSPSVNSMMRRAH
jgi:hypothetical protein